MELKKLCDNVWYLPHSEATDRPALGYVQGKNYALMIDCGNSPAHLALFRQALAAQRLPMPRIAVITHWHWDHSFAMCAFDGLTAACEATDRQLRTMQRWEWTDEAMEQRLRTGEDIAFCDTHIRLEYPHRSQIRIVPADMTFRDTLSFDLGGLHCEARRVGGPHSEDSVVILIPERRILFAGDGHTGDFYGLDGGYDRAKLAAYMDMLRSTDFNIYVHGHVPPVSRAEILRELEAALAAH
ncbi:MAG: MBL fold metallo-hydrolase [Ruminococcaceae bacterium]|nr:MBL fold metallo-hydrolase [Oscillospiraceae bacterium]